MQVARETGYLDGVQNFRSRRNVWPLSAGQGAGAVHRQPGRATGSAARIANDDHPQITLNKGDCVIFSSRTIPGNEKAVGYDHQRAGDAGNRGDHRSHPSRACVRPSAPRRTARHDLVVLAAGADPGPWRSAAPVRSTLGRRAAPRACPSVLICKNGDLLRLGPATPP